MIGTVMGGITWVIIRVFFISGFLHLFHGNFLTSLELLCTGAALRHFEVWEDDDD
jgi:hypothetical protein